jgi:uncharacterized protein (TIGR00369 family)
MNFFTRMQDAKASGDYAGFIGEIPYAKTIGMQMHEDEGGDLIFVLPFLESNIGNHLLPALHGGVIGGFIESAALLQIIWMQESSELPRTIDFSLDYLRSGKAETLYAKCTVSKKGRRVANVVVSAWQENAERPIAVARSHILLIE